MSNKEKSDSFFDLNVQLTSQAKAAFGRVPVAQLEESLGAYLGTLQTEIPPVEEGEDPETVQVSLENLHQLVLLASIPLSRMIVDSYRSNK